MVCLSQEQQHPDKMSSVGSYVDEKKNNKNGINDVRLCKRVDVFRKIIQ